MAVEVAWDCARHEPRGASWDEDVHAVDSENRVAWTVSVVGYVVRSRGLYVRTMLRTGSRGRCRLLLRCSMSVPVKEWRPFTVP